MGTIRPDTRIGDLLKQYPQLLDVLADYAPAFARLRNPLLRRTVGRMATLAQAASLGSVDLAALLRTLRQAVGEPEPAEAHAHNEWCFQSAEYRSAAAIASNIGVTAISPLSFKR